MKNKKLSKKLTAAAVLLCICATLSFSGCGVEKNAAGQSTTEETSAAETTAEETDTEITTAEVTTAEETTTESTTAEVTTAEETTSEETTAERTTAENTAVETTVKETTTDKGEVTTAHGRTVYITPSGKRYHYSESCAGKNAIEKKLDEIPSKYTPCQKCAN